MIAPQELRIGNITDKGIIKNFYESGIHVGLGKCFRFNEIEPIELTEDWLLKFGFEHTTPDGWLCLNICNYWTFLYWQKGLLELSVNRHSVVLQKILYVHQLQNIFFDFTGEELKIKNNERKPNEY